MLNTAGNFHRYVKNIHRYIASVLIIRCSIYNIRIAFCILTEYTASAYYKTNTYSYYLFIGSKI